MMSEFIRVKFWKNGDKVYSETFGSTAAALGFIESLDEQKIRRSCFLVAESGLTPLYTERNCFGDLIFKRGV